MRGQLECSSICEEGKAQLLNLQISCLKLLWKEFRCIHFSGLWICIFLKTEVCARGVKPVRSRIVAKRHSVKLQAQRHRLKEQLSELYLIRKVRVLNCLTPSCLLPLLSILPGEDTGWYNGVSFSVKRSRGCMDILWGILVRGPPCPLTLYRGGEVGKGTECGWEFHFPGTGPLLEDKPLSHCVAPSTHFSVQSYWAVATCKIKPKSLKTF